MTVHSAELISTDPQQLFMPSTVPSPAAFTEGAQSVSSRAHAVGKGPAAGCGVGLSLYYCVYVCVCVCVFAGQNQNHIHVSKIYFSEYVRTRIQLPPEVDVIPHTQLIISSSFLSFPFLPGGTRILTLCSAEPRYTKDGVHVFEAIALRHGIKSVSIDRNFKKKR